MPWIFGYIKNLLRHAQKNKKGVEKICLIQKTSASASLQATTGNKQTIKANSKKIFLNKFKVSSALQSAN